VEPPILLKECTVDTDNPAEDVYCCDVCIKPILIRQHLMSAEPCVTRICCHCGAVAQSHNNSHDSTWRDPWSLHSFNRIGVEPPILLKECSDNPAEDVRCWEVSKWLNWHAVWDYKKTIGSVFRHELRLLRVTRLFQKRYRESVVRWRHNVGPSWFCWQLHWFCRLAWLNPCQREIRRSVYFVHNDIKLRYVSI